MTTTPLTDQQLADIRAREAAATRGPWSTARDAGYAEEYGETFVANWSGEYMLGVGDISLGVGEEAEADLAFVLGARTDVPALLAELDRVRAERDGFADRVDTLTAVAKSNKLAHRIAVEECDRLTTELEQARQQTALCSDCGHVEAAHSEDGDLSCTASGARVTSCSCSYFIPPSA